jgi:NAD(P)-dependent dehydrogenase (short-subunit alcohol dehydrogenase family)
MMSKIWMITGAARGLGLAIAKAALEAGHSVVATARNPSHVEAALTGYGDRVLAVALDVTKPAQAEAAVDAAKKHFGRIDVLVNNAGYGQLGWFENTTPDQIQRQFDTNVFGAMHVTRAVLPLLRAQRGGHVFTISSIAGLIAVAGSSIYAASKFAVEGWMEGLAQELKPLGIGATLVEPGFFKTDFLDSSSVTYGELNIPDYADQTAQFKGWHDNMNHEQVGDPAKLGAALLKLASAKSVPVRFAAGSDAYDVALGKFAALRSEAESLEALSKSTDGEGKVEVLASLKS